MQGSLHIFPGLFLLITFSVSNPTKSCVCPKNENDVLVCGSDGKQYGNPCELECARARNPGIIEFPCPAGRSTATARKKKSGGLRKLRYAPHYSESTTSSEGSSSSSDEDFSKARRIYKTPVGKPVKPAKAGYITTKIYYSKADWAKNTLMKLDRGFGEMLIDEEGSHQEDENFYSDEAVQNYRG